MATLSLPAPAKLNLFLHIIGRRSDGYHLLQTLFQFVDYGDTLNFTLHADSGIQFHCNVSALAGTDNLVLRAARLLQQYAAAQHWHAPAGVRIELHKRLPHGGGLGGGSSDAATTLLALRQLWQLPISDGELRQLGLQLGADVPVFLCGEAAFAQGIGEQLQRATPPTPWYLVLHPGVAVATADIFRHPALPRQHPPLTWPQWDWANTSNDCEALVCDLFPEVAKARDWLLQYAPVRMTGTGACLFGRFEHEAAARAVLEQLPPAWQGFVAQGCNESPLHRALRQLATINPNKQP